MSTSIHQRQQQQPHHLLSNPSSIFPRNPPWQRPISIFGRTGLLILLILIVVVGVVLPSTRMRMPDGLLSRASVSKWKDYTLAQAVEFVAKNGTVIVCAVSQPYLPFLNNWLISIARQKHQDKVLVIAEDYATLYSVNQKWPGHAVLIPPAPDAQTAHKFGSMVYNIVVCLWFFLWYIVQSGIFVNGLRLGVTICYFSASRILRVRLVINGMILHVEFISVGELEVWTESHCWKCRRVDFFHVLVKILGILVYMICRFCFVISFSCTSLNILPFR